MIDLSLPAPAPYAVMGLARSGLLAAQTLIRAGAPLLAWDDSTASRRAAEAVGIPLVDLHAADLSGVRALILSPGIPHSYPTPHPVALRARQAGIPIIGDIELLAWAQPQTRYVGITGTNGKSTSTTLTAHILAAAGTPTQVGGNLGIPALSFAPLEADGVYVLEMSSYQLELTPSLGFDVAVLLNITPDHLDRHGGMDGYIAAKRRIFQQGHRQRGNPRIAVIGIDDPPCRAIAQALQDETSLTLLRISGDACPPLGLGIEGGCLIDDRAGRREIVAHLADCPTLPGRHNGQNAAAAYAIAVSLGVAPTIAAAALKSFPGLAHRQQRAGERDGVRFINDSKATNADAAAKALACYRPIYWIVGGRAKDGGLSGLEPFMSAVAHAFLIGEASEAFAPWLRAQGVGFALCETLERATQAAFACAKRDGRADATVLLSPACASFDQYADFEERGRDFLRVVNAITAHQDQEEQR
jgi:UDP-N-acetylmuramoylalanine--D-glutamate ligase